MKTKLILLTCIIVIMHFSVNAQVKIGNNPTTINSASLLELETTNQGLVLPRISLLNVSSSSPLPSGLLTATVVYNTNSSTTGGSGVGIYYWDGSKWNFIANTSTTANYWSLTGNSGTSYSTNFIGTTDLISVRFRTNNAERMIIDSLGRVGIGISNPAYALSVLSASNPLYLSGVQATAAFTTDSILTIYNGVVKKAPYSVLTGATTNTLNLSGNTLTSTVNGIAATANAVGSVSNTSSVNTIKTTVNGVAGSNVNIINSNTNALTQAGGLVNTVNGVSATTSIPTGTVSNVLGYNSSGSPVYQSASSVLGGSTTNALTLSINTLTSTVNGVAATSSAVGSVSNTSTGNNLSTSVNGVNGSNVSIINSNTNALTQAGGLVTTVNGVSATTSIASGTLSNLLGYNSLGSPVYQPISGLSLSTAWNTTGNTGTSASSNFLGTTDAVDFITKTNNVERVRITSTGNVGIGLSNPSYALSVLSSSNPLYLSGVQATSTFSNDSILTINGGVVKKAPYSALPSGGSLLGWSLTGNALTNPALNFLGTTDANALVFKVNNTQAGYLGTTSNYSTAFGLGASASGNQSTAIGAKAQATASNASLAVGYNATASAQDAIAIGDAAQATTNNEAIAIGHSSTSTAYQGIALGVNSTASTNNQTIAIGVSSTASGYQGIAIGNGASATTNNSALAMGVSASASGYQSTAIGNGSTASAQNATAIGNGASATNANTLILGNGANVGIGLSNPSNKLSVLASSDPLYLSGVQATSSFTSDSILTINAGVVKKAPNSTLTGNFWSLSGNAASSGNFLGTTNTTPLIFKFNSLSAGYVDATSTSLGTSSSATAASSNTAIGYSAIANNSDHETSIGANASATAQYNTAIGYSAQAVNNAQATAIGSSAQANAYQSTALGYNAQATTNSQTTALGNSSLANGTYSTAIGYFAQAVTNAQTTAVGGLSTSNGYQSAAFGYNAQAITGGQTTAIGVGSIANSTANTALGYNALAKTGSNGTALGSNSLTTGQYATAIGSFASASAQNATAIGYNTTASNANTLILGNGANVGIGITNPSNKLSVLAASDPLYLSGVQATSTFSADSVLTINAGVVKKAPYSSLTGNFWSLTGNAGTTYTTNFLGTTDNVGLRFRTNNIERMVIDSIGSIGIGSTNFDPYLREKLLVDYGNTTSNNVANFTGSINDYMQINVQNKNSGTSASSDIVATADNGTDSTNYVDFGINSSTYAPGTENWGGANDAYLYSYSRNLLLGTGKSNSDIIFLSGGGVLKTNAVLRIDGSTGNIIVGKGNNSSLATGNTVRAPNASGTNIAGGILTLQGGSATGTGTGGNVVINGGTSPTGIAGNVVFNTASSERVRIDQNGNVGIGISSPTYKLSVLSASNPLYLSGVQATSTLSTDSLLTINAGIVKKTPYSSFTGNYWATTGNTGTTASTNFIGTTDANDFVTKTNSTERMRVTSAGDIVIGANDGTNSPTGGIIRGANATTGNKAGTDLTLQAGNGTGNAGSGDIVFQTGTAGTANGSASDVMTDKVRITDAGDLVVGSGDNTSSTAGGIIRGANLTGAAHTGSDLTIEAGNGTGANGGGNIIFQTNAGGGANTMTEKIRIDNSGNLGLGVSNPSYKLSVLSASNPLYLSGVQATSTFTTDSLLTINAGVVKKAPFSTLTGNFWSLTGNTGLSASTNFIGTSDATDVVVKTNSTERMHILGATSGSSQAGWTGMGISLPRSALDVTGNYTNKNVFTIQNTASNGYSSVDMIDNSGNLKGTFGYGNSGTGSFFGARDYFSTYGSDLVININNGSYNFFMDGTSGKIGINTGTPQNMLDVSGSQAIGSYAGTNAAPSNGLIVSGTVGVGTSSPNASTKLDVSGSFKLGSNGTVTKNIISTSATIASTAVAAQYSTATVSGTANVVTLNANTNYVDVTFTLPSAASNTQATVTVSPGFDLPDDIVISFARLTSTTQGKIRFMNIGTTSRTLAGTVYITVNDF